MDLSIVVIARNEEKNIGNALKSTLTAIDEARGAGVLDSAEVIFVDSASADSTVEIAKSFPVKIIELDKDWPLSPAAGIFAGYREAKGTFFGVVDGDVKVDKNWFKNGMPYLQRDDKVGCVYGWWEESSQGDGLLFNDMIRNYEIFKVSSAREVDFVGNGVFRRSALESVGGHNPYLRGAEDKDISFRLKNNGYRLLQIPVQFGIHNWDFSYFEYYKSIRGWSIGEGHAAAYAKANGNINVFQWFSKPYSLSILSRILRHMFLVLGTMFSLLCAIIWDGSWVWVSLGLCAVLITLLLKAKSNDRSTWKVFLFNYFHYIPYTLFRHWYFHKGLRLSTPDPKTYPQSKINK